MARACAICTLLATTCCTTHQMRPLCKLLHRPHLCKGFECRVAASLNLPLAVGHGHIGAP